MPVYEYLCRECGTISTDWKEVGKAVEKVICCKCQSLNTFRYYGRQKVTHSGATEKYWDSTQKRHLTYSEVRAKEKSTNSHYMDNKTCYEETGKAQKSREQKEKKQISDTAESIVKTIKKRGII